MMTSDTECDLVVLGAGPGGYTAAFYAADLGMKVVLVDTEANPGGVCLYRGCIPSKALLHVARFLHEAEEAKSWGIDIEKPRVNLDRLHRYVEGVITKLTAGLGVLAKARKIEYIQGRGAFAGASTLRVTPPAGPERRVKFKHAIVATGSRPVELPIFPPASPFVMKSGAALNFATVPGRLLVVGGGYIGLELGSVYAALGSEVTVVEMTSGLMPGADRELVAVLEKRLRRSLKNILLNAKVADAREENGELRVSFDGESLKERSAVFDKVLVSVGRRPNSGEIGLATTKAALDGKEFIRTSADRRTDEPNIYAVGDVAGGILLAHKAAHEARVAVDAIAGKRVVFKPLAIPAVVFTDPEIAWCGLTEDDAKAKGLEAETVKFPWAASGRAVAIGRTEGLTKLVIEKATERILGVGIAGPNAGDMISEGALAVEMGATAADIALTIHPHPTLSETIMEACELFYGRCTHLYRPARK